MEEKELALVRGIPLKDEPGLGALTLPGFLREVTERYSDCEALAIRGLDGSMIRWSYADLWDRSVDIARALIGCGTSKDCRVGVLMTNRLEWVSSAFGTSLAGGVVTGLSTFSTPAELEYLIRASGVSILLFESKVASKDFADILRQLEPGIVKHQPGQLTSVKFPHLRRLVMVDDGAVGGAIESWSDFLAHGSRVPPALIDATAASVNPSDPAILFFSSGSTGKPKGVLNSHRGVSIQNWRWKRIYAVEGPVRGWAANGLFWSAVFSYSLGGTLATGGTLVLQPKFSPGEAIRLMSAERVTLPYCWPHQWAQLEADPSWEDADLSSFHYFDTDRNLRRPQKSIKTIWVEPRAAYGSTETFTISTAYAADTPPELSADSNGEPLPGNTVKIVDPDSGRTLLRGETGEIAVKGPTLMLAYIGVPLDETLDSEGFYRTGDGGHIDQRGRLFFAGRINDIIKTGGANVSPVEVDWILCTLPGVKVCKTTGVPHDTLGEMVVSVVACEAGWELTESGVIAFVQEKLASYKAPRKVLFVTEDELELTGTAKIKPAMVRELAARKIAEEDGSK